MMKKQKLWIGTSWKMNKTHAEAQAFVDGLKLSGLPREGALQLFLVPPFTSVREVKASLQNESVLVGAQNMHWADHGAWTGEISPLMLKDCGLDLVELGHSERREHFGETDETVGLKAETAVRHGLTPLICVGETLVERQSGRASAVLKNQVKMALSRLTDRQFEAPIVFAYEPVWAIGVNGIPATSDYADARQAEIIATARSILGRRIPCLYGGSVNPDNCQELVSCENIDGLFIGRSAWKVDGFIDIIQKCIAQIRRMT